jgi:hypothetical protein
MLLARITHSVVSPKRGSKLKDNPGRSDVSASLTGFARRRIQFHYRVNAKLTGDEERAEYARFGNET